jgi:hypothetical protein
VVLAKGKSISKRNAYSIEDKYLCISNEKEPMNPATKKVEIRRIVIGGQLGQKFSETLSQKNKLSMVEHIYKSSYTGGEDRRIMV